MTWWIGAAESDLGGSLALRDRRAGLPRAPSARVELRRVDLVDLGQMPGRSPAFDSWRVARVALGKDDPIALWSGGLPGLL
jgi:hypothetical protein